MITAIKRLILRARCAMADQHVEFLMSAHSAIEAQLGLAIHRAADLQRKRLLVGSPVLARKAAGEVIYHNFRRPALRVIAGKDAA